MSGKPPRPKALTVDFRGHMCVPVVDELVKQYLGEESHLGRYQSNPRTREISQAQFKKRDGLAEAAREKSAASMRCP